ncbi:hypothetical protein CONPUDRAFT_57638, partial [Coniophora puteana RWD-64-598 SS2]
RYRNTPPFGRATIRRFRKNTSDMKRIAARDFEDILQCSMPVFEGILPNETHNKTLLDLLFDLSYWHAHAKLRLHTDLTLSQFDQAVISLGSSARKFQSQVCPLYDTRELPAETSARGRRAVTKVANTLAKTKQGRVRAARLAQSRHHKRLNLETFKFHSLGDYPDMIRRYGTTDNYSTLPVINICLVMCISR